MNKTVTTVIAVIALILVGAYALTGKNPQEAVEGATDQATEAVEGATEATGEAMEATGEAVADAAEGATEATGEAMQAAEGAVEAAADATADAANAAVEATSEAAGAVADATTAAAEGTVDAAGAAVEGATDAAASAAEGVADAATAAATAATGAATAAVDAAGEAATAATETVADAASSLGAFAKKALPGGTELNVPANGVESQVVDFLNDPAKPVDKTTWFNFDRLAFDTGSATLKAESDEQIKNIADVLKAFPNAKLKIGGYTDNTGNEAANKTLSFERAKAVVNAITAQGIDATRLEAEGYGSDHAVASNDTEEGRAQNRRISLRVTEK